MKGWMFVRQHFVALAPGVWPCCCRACFNFPRDSENVHWPRRLRGPGPAAEGAGESRWAATKTGRMRRRTAVDGASDPSRSETSRRLASLIIGRVSLGSPSLAPP